MFNPIISRGSCLPLGASACPEGVNFCLLCRHCTAIFLVVYSLDEEKPLCEIALHPKRNRTGDHWHVLVKGLPPAFAYGWRVDGPTGLGNHYDPMIVLLDPVSTILSNGAHWGRSYETSPDSTVRRSVFLRRPFHWKEDVPPLTPFEDSIIYELHVRGFTCHPSSLTSNPGTFAGLVEKIPYLQALGVTAVELLPIHEFDENDCPFVNPVTGEKLRNLWGYNSIGFAAPKASYAASGPTFGQINEFREMVRAFHAAGIEVILDVVFNHTGEGDHRGRTYSFRGLDNRLYYMLGPNGEYLNFSGCGNTVNCNHPMVRHLLLECLRFWVADMHVDGLRFDLASVMGRDEHGRVLVEPPVVELIAEDGILSDTKLIAEPWDAAGLYQVGRFPFGRRWSEWNGQYRDQIRRFWRGEPGMAAALATRLCGSSDLYESTGRSPRHSINFITCHDGFTLWDLVSYDHKHNEANGEGNRDGSTENYSFNCGVEGATTNPEILGLRRRQVRNLMTTLMLSQGIPMILAGDEFLRSQGGNNNAWCQDNEIGWTDWRLKVQNADFFRFVCQLIALRRRHPVLRRRQFLDKGDVVWHGMEPFQPDFSFKSHTLALTLDGQRTGREPDEDVYMAFNAWTDPLPFVIPPSFQKRPWHRVIDTALASPLDIVLPGEGPVLPVGSKYQVAPFSLIVLITEE